MPTPGRRLTDRMIAGISGPGPRAESADGGAGGISGLVLRVSADGTHRSWQLRKYAAGRRHKITLGDHGVHPTETTDAARVAAVAALAQIQATGEAAPVGAPAGGVSFDRLCDRYCAERLPGLKPATQTEHRRRIDRYLRTAWSGRSAGSIRFTDVYAVTQPIALRAPVEARRVHVLISAIYAWAVAHDIDAGILFNPCAGRPQPAHTEIPRARVLTDPELARLVTVCANRGAGTHHTAPAQRAAAALVLIELFTAQRGIECQTLRWSDLTRRPDPIWTIPATITKNKRVHTVPLTPRAVEILDRRGWSSARRRQSAAYVFPGRTGHGPIVTPQRAIRSIYRIARLPQGGPDGVTRHDLRRTVATRLAAAQTAPAVISRILNHAPPGPRVTRVYNVYSYLDEMRAALEAWADTVDDIATAG